jgi:hypothetical protein
VRSTGIWFWLSGGTATLFFLFCFSRLCFTFLAAALQKRSGLSRLEFVRREADGFETLQTVPGRRGGMPTGLVSACVFQTFLLFLLACCVDDTMLVLFPSFLSLLFSTALVLHPVRIDHRYIYFMYKKRMGDSGQGPRPNPHQRESHHHSLELYNVGLAAVSRCDIMLTTVVERGGFG